MKIKLHNAQQGHAEILRVWPEIKDGHKKTLTRLQQDFFGNWCGGGLHRINNAEEALHMIGITK